MFCLENYKKQDLHMSNFSQNTVWLFLKLETSLGGENYEDYQKFLVLQKSFGKVMGSYNKADEL